MQHAKAVAKAVKRRTQQDRTITQRDSTQARHMDVRKHSTLAAIKWRGAEEVKSG